MPPLAVSDLRVILPDIVDALPPAERHIVTALYWEQMSLREIAEEIGVHHTTIMRIRDRAFQRIQELTR